jgi:hypothetical protein
MRRRCRPCTAGTARCRCSAPAACGCTGGSQGVLRPALQAGREGHHGGSRRQAIAHTNKQPPPPTGLLPHQNMSTRSSVMTRPHTTAKAIMGSTRPSLQRCVDSGAGGGDRLVQQGGVGRPPAGRRARPGSPAPPTAPCICDVLFYRPPNGVDHLPALLEDGDDLRRCRPLVNRAACNPLSLSPRAWLWLRATGARRSAVVASPYTQLSGRCR